eukprot:8280587-Pyramimonas_sp.AAC.1
MNKTDTKAAREALHKRCTTTGTLRSRRRATRATGELSSVRVPAALARGSQRRQPGEAARGGSQGALKDIVDDPRLQPGGLEALLVRRVPVSGAAAGDRWHYHSRLTVLGATTVVDLSLHIIFRLKTTVVCSVRERAARLDH